MKQKLGYKYERIWKMFIIFSGSNDICDVKESDNAIIIVK